MNVEKGNIHFSFTSNPIFDYFYNFFFQILENLNLLPNLGKDIIYLISNFLDLHTLLSLSMTNKYWL